MTTKRTYNPRLIKATWPYTVQEIAELLKVHKNAVTRWIAEGLVADCSSRPYLIRGKNLIDFIVGRQAKRRAKCGLGQFYCLKCRGPRDPYLGIVDLNFIKAGTVRLESICAECSTKVHKVQSASQLDKIRSHFHVQSIAGEHIYARTDPFLNRDLETNL